MNGALLPVLAQLGPWSDGELAAEQPLFAAEQTFAAEMGGPITRAFLASLPEDWRAGELVVDSHLVGLPPGYDPGPTIFHREVYPEQRGGGFDVANGELDVEHACCVFGLAMPEVLVGEIDEAALPAMSAWDDGAAVQRDAVLRSLLAAGRLLIVSPAPGAVWRCDGRTYLRWTKAGQPGMHLWLRATRGSRRPWANGRRNLGMKG